MSWSICGSSVYIFELFVEMPVVQITRPLLELGKFSCFMCFSCENERIPVKILYNSCVPKGPNKFFICTNRA